MNYPDRTIVNGHIIPDSITKTQLWKILYQCFSEIGAPPITYNVTLGMTSGRGGSMGRTSKLSFDEIGDALEDDKEGSVLGITVDGNKTNPLPLSINYFGSRGFLAIGTSAQHSVASWDRLLSAVSEQARVHSICATPASYRESQRDHFIPKQTDLWIAPSHFNDAGGRLVGVSAEMWLGEDFWKQAACTKEDVLSADWLTCEDRGHHVHLQAWPEPFSTAEGEQGEIQRRLLTLLFGISGPRGTGEPPPLPNDAHRIEADAVEPLDRYILKAKGGDRDSEEVLLATLLRSDCFLLTRSQGDPNTPARMRDPESGEAKLVLFSSRSLAEGAVRKRPDAPSRHVTAVPFRSAVQACGDALGIVLNPFEDSLLVEMSAAQVKEIRARIDPPS